MDNIVIYYEENSESCFYAIQWLKEHNLPVELRKVGTITHKEIFQLIYLSDMEVLDILKESNKYLKSLHFGESLIFLEKNTELLKIPIVLSNEYSLSGYDEQKIKSFLSCSEKIK